MKFMACPHTPPWNSVRKTDRKFNLTFTLIGNVLCGCPIDLTARPVD